ncbi:DNA-3-methyladenine glycosylase 1 [Methanosarcinaceae archaeon Ag5]|uniref:DNA-3-methyladenine glycosylase 1 n=1 Tax=Methanolapillus africanus TaxID=3028297 RepID=A0AAE4ML19_9EURY|nr:DNA-3-methyladenine glycosylase 1 [Methanosarcinaceae archaeon Ag5]
MKNKTRCAWAGNDSLYQNYHDNEWGRPVHDDRILFEMLILEGMQAGLSWITVLKKRENFREAFDNFDPNIVAGYGADKIETLMGNSGIIKNRLKINSAVTNAQAFLKIQDEFGSFDNFLWAFVDNNPIKNSWKSMSEVPPQTELSDKISKELKKRGFKFIGSTIVYAYMQAVGVVDDHTADCFLYEGV